LTVDVGGGTTDVSAYAYGNIVFRNSVLFGGCDLIGGPAIYPRIEQWARDNKLLTAMQDSALAAYPSFHTKFTYLARLPWFKQNLGTLATAPWFMNVQAAILYFFGANLYNIGLRLRGLDSSQGEPADLVFFGGNGSAYLDWLVEFRPWNSAPINDDKPDPTGGRKFASVLQSLFEAGLGQPLGHTLKIRASSRPKLEVALGLLATDNYPQYENIVSHPPVGEHLTLPLGGGQAKSLSPDEALDGGTVAQVGPGRVQHAKPFAEWEITKFNNAFVDGLSKLKAVDTQWDAIAAKVRKAVDALPAKFFQNRNTLALSKILADDTQVLISLFILEAEATLREIERALFEA
jgi:hypothetical protein